MRLTKEDQQALSATLAPYLADEAVQQMASYTQHGTVSTLDHCKSVARLSLWICRRLHLRVNTNALLVGALLHDFYLYDWHGSGWRHSYLHPERARANAVAQFGVDEPTQHVIRCHMWPLGITHVPTTKEAIVVNIADKIVSLRETVLMRRERK
jgi:uncharacterized protein